MDFSPTPPVTSEESYAPFWLPEERLRPVSPLDALRAETLPRY